MKALMVVSLLVGMFGLSSAVYADPNDGCTADQVMETVHNQSADYINYTYLGNYDGNYGPPTQQQHEDEDQYFFMINNGTGEMCLAIATYQSGFCTDGTATIKYETCK